MAKLLRACRQRQCFEDEAYLRFLSGVFLARGCVAGALPCSDWGQSLYHEAIEDNRSTVKRLGIIALL